MQGLDVLQYEAAEFVAQGSKINIVNPQSSAEDGFNGKYLIINGQTKLDFTRLDYLALGSSPIMRSVMIDSINNYDISCPASQMVMKAEPNLRLERTLAELHGMNESIVFTNGYSANVNVIEALALRINTPHLSYYARKMGIGKMTKHIPTIFYLDSESHFSLQHGIRTAKSVMNGKCIVNTFPSGDYNYLTNALFKFREKHHDNALSVIVSDTLSSASGKIFDVPALCKIAEEYNCLLYLDEAHAVGALGPQGSGIAADYSEFATFKDRILLMGTLTKTFSQLGGYVTMTNSDLSWFLRFCSPQYIFSAPVPPWMADATVNMIKMLSGDFGEQKRLRLKSISNYLRKKLLENCFNILGSESHIVPVLIGDQSTSDKIKLFMEQNGFVVSLFKYPAVQKDASLIRFSLCADILEEEVDEAVKFLIAARDKFCE